MGSQLLLLADDDDDDCRCAVGDGGPGRRVRRVHVPHCTAIAHASLPHHCAPPLSPHPALRPVTDASSHPPVHVPCCADTWRGPGSGSSFAEPLVLRVSGMARKTPGSAYHGSGGGDSPGAGSSSTAGLRRALAGAGARDLVGAAGELQQRAASLLGQVRKQEGRFTSAAVCLWLCWGALSVDIRKNKAFAVQTIKRLAGFQSGVPFIACVISGPEQCTALTLVPSYVHKVPQKAAMTVPHVPSIDYPHSRPYIKLSLCMLRSFSCLLQRPASAPLATSLGLSAVASHGAGLGLVSPPLSARVHSISASAVSEGLAPGGPGATGTGMAGSALSAAPKQRPASAGVLYSKALPSGGGHVGAMAGGHGATAGAGAGTGKAAAVAVGGSAVSKARLSSPFVRSLSSSGSAAAAVVAGSGARAGGVLRRSFDGAWGGQGATAAGGSSIATVPSKPNVHETPASTLGGAAAVAVRAPSPPAQPPPNERSRPSVVARSAWGPGTPGNVGALVAEPASAASLKSRVMRLGLQRCLSAPGLGSAAETETGTGAGTAAGAPSAASAPDVAAAATRQPPSPRTWQDSDRGAAEGQDHGGFDAAAPTAAASSRSSSTSSSHGSGARTVATGSGTSASASGSAAALASAAQPQAQAPVCPTVAAAATGNAGGSTDPFAAAAVSAVSGGQHATTTAASMASAAAAVAKPGVSQATAAFTPLAIGSGSSGSGTGAGGPRAVGQPAPAVPASAALQRSTSMPAGSSSASPAAAGAGGRPHTPATCAFGLSTIVNRDPAPTQTVQPQPQPPSKAAARADGTVVAGAGAVGNSSTASTASGTVASHGGAAGAAAAAAGRGSSAEAGPGTGRTLTPSHSLTREAAKHLTVDLSQVGPGEGRGRGRGNLRACVQTEGLTKGMLYCNWALELLAEQTSAFPARACTVQR